MSLLTLHLSAVDEALGPEGDPRGWLLSRARLAPDMPEPMAALVFWDAEGLFAVNEGLPMALIGAGEDALWQSYPDIRWVGAVGSAVLKREGRPLLVRWARLRFADGKVWVATWLRVPGMSLAPVADETWTGPLDQLPPWLAPLFAGAESDGPTVTLVPAALVLPWREDPGVPAPHEAEVLPPEVDFQDVVLFAAGRLEGRFRDEGRVNPTLVVWSGEDLLHWTAKGARGARELSHLGHRLAQDADVHAIGIFGLGEDEGDEGGRLPMIALAMEHRDVGSVLWVRRFERTDADKARWIDPHGQIRVPAPSLGWFKR